MWKVFLLIGSALVWCVRCSASGDSKKDQVGKKIGIHALYMKRIYVGENGWPESDLYLGCDDRVKERIKVIDTISNFGPMRMRIPCEVLNGIDDTLKAMDSILEFNKPFPQVWFYYRYTLTDSGVDSTRKMFTYENGKKHLWWMMDYILKHSPESFKTAKVSYQPLPARSAPPDSAWLDTLKRGLF
jgi:hypothetical protein